MKFVITETQLIKQCNFQKNYDIIESMKFVVGHLCYSFSMDPQDFPQGQIYTKNYHFGDFGSLIFKATMVKFGVSVRTCTTVWNFRDFELLKRSPSFCTYSEPTFLYL